MPKIAENLIQNQFKKVEVYQELSKAQQEISQLTLQVEELQKRGAIVRVPLKRVVFNDKQARQTFQPKDTLALARSLERDGQEQPIFVFALDSGDYLVFDGQRRCLAAPLVGWEALEALVLPLPQNVSTERLEVLRRRTLLASKQRENLNDLDLAEALIAEIQDLSGLEPESIQKGLSSVKRRFFRQKQGEKLTSLSLEAPSVQEKRLKGLEDQGLLDSEELNILSYLLSLQLNPFSIEANVFPCLKLFPDLKDAVRKQGLGVYHAKVLQQLNSEKLQVPDDEAKLKREEVMSEVIRQEWSIARTRQRVNEILHPKQPSQFSKEIESAIASISKIKVREDEDPGALKILESALKKKLKELGKVLKDNDISNKEA